MMGMVDELWFDHHGLPILERPTYRMITLSPDLRIHSRPLGPGEFAMKKIVLGISLLCTAVCFAAKQKPLQGADLLRELEAEFAADVAQHGHDAFITHFAEDGVEVVDGGGFNTNLNYVSLNAPSTVVDIGFKGMFISTVRP